MQNYVRTMAAPLSISTHIQKIDAYNHLVECPCVMCMEDTFTILIICRFQEKIMDLIYKQRDKKCQSVANVVFSNLMNLHDSKYAIDSV